MEWNERIVTPILGSKPAILEPDKPRPERHFSVTTMIEDSLVHDRAPQNPEQVTDLLPELHETLLHAQRQRQQYSSVEADGTPEWVAHERSVMFDATTALLIRHHLPLGRDSIAAAVHEAEQVADGSADPARQWALGCAEFVADRARAKQGNHE